MSESNLRTQIKEMLVKNLMLQVTPEQIGDELPLFGPDGLGLDSIDALELVVSMEKTFGVGVPSASDCEHDSRLHSRKARRGCVDVLTAHRRGVST